MYEDFTAPLPDLGAYLERIGLAGCELPPTMDSLCALMHAHLTHIPFENLDAWDRGEAPLLGIPDIFDKVVIRRRGGWCFELNALFKALLDALGFETYTVGARVMVGRDYFPAVSHRGTVCLLDGKRYYCDVGFGDVLFRAPVPMDGSVSQFGFSAKQNGEYTEIWQGGEKPRRLVMFIDRPYEAVDFMFANYTNSVKPGLPFRENLYVSILTEDGHRKLLYNHVLKETEGGMLLSSCEAADRAGVSALLLEHFGIDYPLR